MRLRSRSTASPVHDDNSSYNDSSDEDDFLLESSDSDYCEVIDEGEDSGNMMEGNEGRQVFNLNLIPDDESSEEGFLSDVDLEIEVTKKRKVESRKGKGPRARRSDEQQNWIDVLPDLQQGVAHVEVKKEINDKKKKNKRKRKDRPTLMWEVWEEEFENWIDQNITNDVDLDNQSELIAETAEPPKDLTMPLLRYQKEWLAWALKQEESATRGGILADEMGMGKTVQAIALVIAKRELRQAIYGPSGRLSPPSSSIAVPEVKGTLVICPVVAALQWVNEIERFTSKGSNRVLVYHGAKRSKSLQHLSEYDFVITTYSIVEAEYRKNVMPPKQKCQWCGKKFYDHKMSVHLKYFCGPNAVKTDKQSKQLRKGRKTGVKLSKQETTSEGKGSKLKFNRKKAPYKKSKKYHKEDKGLGIDSSSEKSADFEQESQRKKSILHSVKWERIILDEAHYIKDRRANTTKAILALQSSYKWALSGTPLQNRVGELYSLVRFLQIVPYSYYFCKDCDCRVLDYSSSTDCSSCPHKSVRHFCWWNRYIAKPIQCQGNSGEGNRAMILLKNKLLKSIVLRRTKKGRAADLALPPTIVKLRRDTLDIKEEDYYQSLYNESQAQFNTYVEAGNVQNNYAHIFDLLTRLRQAVDHPYLVVYSSTAVGQSDSLVEVCNDEQVCDLCHETAEDPVVPACAHIFCKSCLIDFSASLGQVLCPTCSKPLTVDFSTNVDHNQTARVTIKGFKRSSILNRIRLDDFQTSTKIDALREEIRFMVVRDGSAKAIVFSQFTSFLDLIHYSLQKSGIKCVQLVGSMTMGTRDAAISRFTEDPDCRIFLMSLKAGGVALNLTVASHVFLMDPWWNPAVERQAQDRIHRIGQYKPIRIVRFVIENTIEERILKLQEKKELVFEGTVGGSSEALGKLTEADLRFLFVT